MKVIDATWDEKITGLKTCEIIFKKGDTFESYLSASLEKDFRFIVTKIPLNDLKLVHQLEDIGYRYLENQMMLSFDLSRPLTVDEEFKRLLDRFYCQPVLNVEGLGKILSEVSDNLFESDRYTLDPFWPKGKSAERYANWIWDLFSNKGTRFFELIHNGENNGFFVMQEESPFVGRCPIAGIYKRFKGAGYIFPLTWFWLEMSRREGKKKVITSVSSNNRIMLSSLSKAFSFRICETLIVMRKVIL